MVAGGGDPYVDSIRKGRVRMLLPHFDKPRRSNAAALTNVCFGVCDHAARSEADRQDWADSGLRKTSICLYC